MAINRNTFTQIFMGHHLQLKQILEREINEQKVVGVNDG